MIVVNGIEKPYRKMTVKHMLDDLQLESKRVVVEVNHRIISQEDYRTHQVMDGDRVEIVRFVGGG